MTGTGPNQESSRRTRAERHAEAIALIREISKHVDEKFAEFDAYRNRPFWQKYGASLSAAALPVLLLVIPFYVSAAVRFDRLERDAMRFEQELDKAEDHASDNHPKRVMDAVQASNKDGKARHDSQDAALEFLRKRIERLEDERLGSFADGSGAPGAGCEWAAIGYLLIDLKPLIGDKQQQCHRQQHAEEHEKGDYQAN